MARRLVAERLNNACWRFGVRPWVLTIHRLTWGIPGVERNRGEGAADWLAITTRRWMFVLCFGETR